MSVKVGIPQVGQSKLKQILLSQYGCCKICGLDDERLLIASHIKPWCTSNASERLDGNNVLLLCAKHDALFDKGLITFDENGHMIVSPTLSQNTKYIMGINDPITIGINQQNRKYLKWHSEMKFIRK